MVADLQQPSNEEAADGSSSWQRTVDGKGSPEDELLNVGGRQGGWKQARSRRLRLGFVVTASSRRRNMKAGD